MSYFIHAPFFWNGQLTTVEQSLDGEFRLTHLVDGTWEKGRRIRLPALNSQWVDGPQGPRIGSDSELSVNRIFHYLTVIPVNDSLHIRFVTKGRANRTVFAAYRKGFDYDDDAVVSSAESPENAERDSAGWEQFTSTVNDPDGGGSFSVEEGGVLLGLHDKLQSLFVRRGPDGQWKVLSGLAPSTEEFDYDTLISGPSERAYVCRQSSEWWGRFAFFPVDGNTIRPAQLTLPGDEAKYLNRWGAFISGLLLAWIVHVLVLIGNQQLCQRSTDVYEFGTERMFLASSWQRGLAFLIDATAILLVVAISFLIHWNTLGGEWDRNADRKISRLLSNAEMNVRSSLNVADCLSDPKEFIGRPRDFKRFLTLLFTIFVDTFVPLWLYRTYREGETGVTPGKWLTGIRTVRSTLRPCGFGRAVVRSAMSLVDFALLITPLPATISSILSPSRQRVGDRVADTLVIRSR